MTRYTVTNDEVPHLWAHQAQEHASNGRGSLRFEGRSLYSYGTEIARLVEAPDGALVALHNGSGYSITTTQHQHRARMATNHMPSFVVVTDAGRGWSFGEFDPLASAADYRRRLEEKALGVTRARSNREWALQYLNELAAEFNRFCDVFRLDVERAPVYSEADLPELSAAAKARAAERKAAEKAEREKRRAKAEAMREVWRTGERVSSGWWSGSLPIALRVHRDDKGEAVEIETSRGARFPVADARRAWPFIQRVRGTSGVRHLNPHEHPVKLGPYRIDSIDTKGDVVAGCHRVKYDEIRRCAVELGLIEGA